MSGPFVGSFWTHFDDENHSFCKSRPTQKKKKNHADWISFVMFRSTSILTCVCMAVVLNGIYKLNGFAN